MNKKKLFLIVQSILCIVITGWLIVSVIGIYAEGSEIKAEQPLNWIFNPEKVAASLGPVLPLIMIGLVLTAVGLILGIQSENAKKTGKAQIKLEKAGGVNQNTQKEKNQTFSRVRLIRLTVLVLAAGLIAAGIFNGSAMDVFGKAIKICTECVGLG